MHPKGGGGGGTVRLWALLVLAVTHVSRCAAGDIVRTFMDEGTEKFNHMVVDKNTGRVFIGAVNRLYQLSPELDQVMSEITGPFEDSPDCSVLDCPPNVLKKPTDNVNKALVIDYTTTRLISCGSLFQVRTQIFFSNCSNFVENIYCWCSCKILQHLKS
jgi:plexin A